MQIETLKKMQGWCENLFKIAVIVSLVASALSNWTLRKIVDKQYEIIEQVSMKVDVMEQKQVIYHEVR